MPNPVVVKPHDPHWFDLFRSESAVVARALAPHTCAIHHIGSTAIPTIHAKPIVDMLVEVSDIHAVDDRNPAMEAIGYVAMGEFGIAGRRYFRKNNEHGVRVFHVHAFATGSPEIDRHLAFRDYLLAHPEPAAEYSELKQALAAAHPDDIDAYMDGKDAFIKRIEALALGWHAQRGQRS
jgi:GrpB-like predicted nucleotidyltransferase (UPF0157 family)